MSGGAATKAAVRALCGDGLSVTAPQSRISIAAYAKLRGCDPQTVRRAREDGRLSKAAAPVDRHGRPQGIVVEIAEVEWPREAGGANGAATAGVAPPEPDPFALRLTEARVLKAEAAAQKAQIDTQKALGDLVDAHAAKGRSEELFRRVRDTILAAGRNAGPKAIGMTESQAGDAVVAVLEEAFRRLAVEVREEWTQGNN